MIKIALVHDYLKEYGGAERVLESLHEIWPKAPVFTTVYLPNYLGPHRGRFAGWDIRPSILQYLPFKAKLISLFRLVAPLIFKSKDFSRFDAVIVSATGAYSPNLIKKGKAVQICYCHTPPRYLYGYATARNWRKNPVFKFLAEIANHFLRMADFRSSQKVDFFIANSQEIAFRIKKFYCRDARVIYPPVEIPDVSREMHLRGVYYLTGGRLARPKQIHLAVAACTKLKLPLIVFGKEFAGYGEELHKIAGKTVEFVGEITDEAKLKLMAQARAFIFPSDAEDFGITPVEAMSMGTPVIAFRSGGVTESVVDLSTGSGQGATGVFFDDPTVESLIKAIRKFDKLTFRPEDCINQAKKFSKERFKKEMLQFVKDVCRNKN